eukprot:PhM_4_TR4638/c0_g1_i1/m.99772
MVVTTPPRPPPQPLTSKSSPSSSPYRRPYPAPAMTDAARLIITHHQNTPTRILPQKKRAAVSYYSKGGGKESSSLASTVVSAPSRVAVPPLLKHSVSTPHIPQIRYRIHQRLEKIAAAKKKKEDRERTKQMNRINVDDDGAGPPPLPQPSPPKCDATTKHHHHHQEHGIVGERLPLWGEGHVRYPRFGRAPLAMPDKRVCVWHVDEHHSVTCPNVKRQYPRPVPRRNRGHMVL